MKKIGITLIAVLGLVFVSSAQDSLNDAALRKEKKKDRVVFIKQEPRKASIKTLSLSDEKYMRVARKNHMVDPSKHKKN